MTNRECAIDIESYSDVEIDRGVYAYVDSPNFEIVLVAYKFSDEDRVKQFMPGKFCNRPGVFTGAGEQISMDGDEPLAFDGDENEFLEAMKDKSVLKTAFNANFERTCIAKYYGIDCDPDDWRCTMVLVSVAGLPRKLKDAGDALGLPEDEKKLRTGNALIQYFCKPVSPTKSNGMRTRNLPKHDMARWRLFCEYNRQDVVTEQAIRQRLKAFQPNAEEQKLWSVDQHICDRGIRIDRPFVEGIVRHDAERQEILKAEAREITGLENPNSVSKLKEWFTKRGVQSLSNDLSKDAISEALKESYPADVTRVLQIRKALGKTSTSKYVAMLGSVCHDDRVRGMLQFYGANRTGRWCLTGDHEVLSKDGWVRLDEWTGGSIACWNKSTEAVSFQNAGSVSFPYKGPMYTYKDVRIDQCSTPDHRMRVQRKANAEWQDMTVEEMSRCRPCIPVTGYRYHRGCVNPAWLRVLVMTQADGHYTNDGAVRFHFKKLRKIERCKHLLRKAEIAYVIGTDKASTTITIPARAVPLWLREFRSKAFGFWLFDENPDIFFDELPNWDGYYLSPNSIQYSTCSKQNADIVQALAHMSGRTANVRIKRHNAKNPNWRDAYVVDIWLTPKSSHEIRNKPIISDFDGTVYCAETTTGYFLVRRNGKVWVTGNSGRIVQLQNLPQNHIPDLDLARQIVAAGDFETLEMFYGETGQVLSELVRTAFIPSEGNRFVVTDFSAIEARVIAWLAGEEWRLDVFRNGGDIYCQSASQMFHVPVEKHGVNGHLRQQGKIAELACGYGGGIGAIKAMDKAGAIPDDEIQGIIDRWRKASPAIVKLWGDYEKAALTAIREKRTVRRGVRIGTFEDYSNREAMADGPVRPYSVRDGVYVAFTYKDGNLLVRLPSGRKITYWGVTIGKNRFGRDAMHYMGVNQETHKWGRIETYGGRLVENLTQSVARDCLAAKLTEAHERGYKVVAHVHDEMIIDVPKADANAATDIDAMMAEPIPWAPGLPLKGGTYECDYYQKD